MDQLPHAAVGIAEFVGDVILREPLDEDGSQRLVLTMVGRRIGIQEELATAVEVHGCTLECESVFGDCSTRTSYQTGGPRQSRTTPGLFSGRNRGCRSVARQNGHDMAAENRLT